MLNIHLFGKFSVVDEELPSLGRTSRKAQELCGYLLLYRDRPHPRETLANVLWGESATAQARTYLRKALWQLQTMLAAPARCRPFLVTSEWVQVNPQADLWLDVASFEQVSTQVQDLPGAQFDGPTAAAVQQAVALHQGMLLEGWYHDWCLYERERL